jgi:hypothetical protein
VTVTRVNRHMLVKNFDMWLKMPINVHCLFYHISKKYSLMHAHGTYKKLFVIYGPFEEHHWTTSANLNYSAKIRYIRKEKQSIRLVFGVSRNEKTKEYREEQRYLLWRTLLPSYAWPKLDRVSHPAQGMDVRLEVVNSGDSPLKCNTL